MKKLFSVSLKGKASDWYKLLDNSDLLEWQELMSLFYAKFYPLREIHQDMIHLQLLLSRRRERRSSLGETKVPDAQMPQP